MYRVQLTEEQREELTRRARRCAGRVRERLEMVRLSDAGWSAPRIAMHLSRDEVTVRTWLKAFLEHAFEGLADEPHRGRVSRLTPAHIEALKEEVRQQERTW